MALKDRCGLVYLEGLWEHYSYPTHLVNLLQDHESLEPEVLGCMACSPSPDHVRGKEEGIGEGVKEKE